MRICGNSGEVLGDGEFGEITIRSPFCILEYFRSGRRAIDEDGWYSTGDLGAIVGGELFVVGRKDDMIVTRGKNIFAHDVEAHLAGIPGVKPGRSAALGIESETTDTVELVIVFETNVPAADMRKLRRTVSQSVEYQFGIAPSAVHIVPNGWVVKTSSGKISRKTNVERLRAMLSTERDSEPDVRVSGNEARTEN
jgi:acyl-CoA synthetase (AMP-forming)/AMP-acid ligase II